MPHLFSTERVTLFANSSSKQRTWYFSLPPSFVSARVQSKLKSCEYIIATKKLNVASVSEIMTNKADSSSPSLSKPNSSYLVISNTSSIANGANRVEQEIKIDFAVLPETKSQGLFHQIQKEVTFCGLPHEAYA